MNENYASPTGRSADEKAHSAGAGSAASAAAPPGPQAAARAPGWTGGRITALATGALLALVSVALLIGGGAAWWADATQRDAAGYLTTGVHEFATSGSALATGQIDLGSAGTGWLYSPVLLDTVRIRVTPVRPGPALFAGIGPSAAVDRYLAGVSHTLISDFWTGKVQAIGGTAGSAPATQHFWAASATGSGPTTLRWGPAGGSWTVVVMNADGRPGIHVRADLAATMPALPWIAAGLLAAGAVVAASGALLIAWAIRRRASRPSTV